jgi:hypothetical protein
MIRGLAMVLGMLTVGVVVVLAGPVLPASADLIFGDCAAIVGPAICPGDSHLNILHWSSSGTGFVTTQAFLNPSGNPDALTQFVDLVDGGQSGLGITSQVGANILDNEITNFPIVRNGISISPSSSSTKGTITIDSLQTLPAPLVGQETAEVCAEPFAGVFGGANCVSTTLGPVAQTIPLPAAYTGPGGALPVLAVDATGSLLSDVKIRDFDLVAVVPEPATIGLVLTGMVGLVLARKRRNLI